MAWVFFNEENILWNMEVVKSKYSAFLFISVFEKLLGAYPRTPLGFQCLLFDRGAIDVLALLFFIKQFCCSPERDVFGVIVRSMDPQHPIPFFFLRNKQLSFLQGHTKKPSPPKNKPLTRKAFNTPLLSLFG